MKMFRLMMIVCISSFMNNYGMEEEKAVSPYDFSRNVGFVAGLKHHTTEFEQFLDRLQGEVDKPLTDSRRTDITMEAAHIADRFSGLTVPLRGCPDFQGEIDRRSSQGLPSQVHTEMTSLFSWLQDAVATDKKSPLTVQLDRLQEKKMAVEDRELEAAELYESQLKTLDVIKKFFKLSLAHPTAFKMCRKSDVPFKLLTQLIHDPELLDQIGEQCYDRWYGEGSFGRVFRKQIEQDLESLEGSLACYYQQAWQDFQDEQKVIRKRKPYKLCKFKGGEEYEEDKDRVNKKIDQYDGQIKQEDEVVDTQFALADRCYHQLRAGESGPAPSTSERASVHHKKEKEVEHTTSTAPGSVIPLNPGVPEKFSRQIARIISQVPATIQKLTKIALAYQCLDDLYSHLIAASGDPDYILSDLAARLRIDDAALETYVEPGEKKKDKVGQRVQKPTMGVKDWVADVSDLVHDGMVAGRRGSHFSSALPDLLNDGCETLDNIAVTIKSVAEIGDGKRTGEEGWLQNFGKWVATKALKGDRADKIFEASFNVNGIGDKLRLILVPFITRFLNAMQESMQEQQLNIIKFDALTRLLKMHALCDARTRNIGGVKSEFRRWFDQLGRTWNEPHKAKSQAFDSQQSQPKTGVKIDDPD